jgi:hypothetical protein
MPGVWAVLESRESAGITWTPLCFHCSVEGTGGISEDESAIVCLVIQCSCQWLWLSGTVSTLTNLVQLEILVGDEGSAVRRLEAGVGLPKFPHKV